MRVAFAGRFGLSGYLLGLASFGTLTEAMLQGRVGFVVQFGVVRAQSGQRFLDQQIDEIILAAHKRHFLRQAKRLLFAAAYRLYSRKPNSGLRPRLL